EEVLGKFHPQLAPFYMNMGYALSGLARHAESRSYLGRALALREQAFGRESGLVAQALGAVCRQAPDEGRYAAAVARCRRALAIAEKNPQEPLVEGFVRHFLARALFFEGRNDEARASAEHALRLFDARKSPLAAPNRVLLGRIDLAEGDLARSRPRLERAREALERTYGPAHPHVG